MNIKHTLATLLGAIAFAGSAHAASLTSSVVAPNNIVEDYSTDGLIAFNLDLEQLAGTSLTFTLDAADLAGPTVGFNALIKNLADGQPLSYFGFWVSGAAFSPVQGSVTPQFGSLGSVKAGAKSVELLFDQPEYAELHFGNPLVQDGKLDWSFSTAGLKAGDTITITSAVPEPGSVAMLLAGLGLVGFAARRRK